MLWLVLHLNFDIYHIYAFQNICQFEGSDCGVINAVTPGKIIVDCSTLTPERMVQQDEMVKLLINNAVFLEWHIS